MFMLSAYEGFSSAKTVVGKTCGTVLVLEF